MVRAELLDPRVRRTRQRLQQALLDLASRRPLDEISVSDLTASASVNRATFYAHYRDRDALLLDAIDGLMEQTAQGTASVTEDEVADPFHPPRHTLDLFLAIDRHAGLYRQILGPGGSAAAMTRMRNRLAAAIQVELERRVAPNSAASRGEQDVQASFLAGAIVGVAADWVAAPTRRPVADIAAATWRLALATGAELALEPLPEPSLAPTRRTPQGEP